MIDKNEVYIHYLLHQLKQESQCIDKQVACIITDRSGRIVSHGINRVLHCNKDCHDKENRLCVVNHAEVTAVQNLNKNYITSNSKGKAYLTLFPCAPCQLALEPYVDEIIVFGPKHKDQVFKNITLKENYIEELIKENGIIKQLSVIQSELGELISSVADFQFRTDKGQNVEPVLDEIVDVENQLIALKEILWRHDKETYNKLFSLRIDKTIDLFGRLVAGLL